MISVASCPRRPVIAGVPYGSETTTCLTGPGGNQFPPILVDILSPHQAPFRNGAPAEALLKRYLVADGGRVTVLRGTSDLHLIVAMSSMNIPVGCCGFASWVWMAPEM